MPVRLILHRSLVQSFNEIYDGRDIIGRSRTGTGKTLAFVLPTVERLRTEAVLRGRRAPRFMVLAPTRELAKQVANEVETFAPDLSCLVAYGQTSIMQQESALRRGIDVYAAITICTGGSICFGAGRYVGTPGRTVDLINRGALDLSQLQCLTLDEADEMLKVAQHVGDQMPH